jgi:hypothetical protein
MQSAVSLAGEAPADLKLAARETIAKSPRKIIRSQLIKTIFTKIKSAVKWPYIRPHM